MSKLFRRTHMYLALFFAPWMLMYALSTLAMNHREFLIGLYGGKPVQWQKEVERVYPDEVSETGDVKLAGSQILASLGLNTGSFDARRSPDGQRITIMRDDPVAPRRVTYSVADRKVVVEKQVFRAPAFLEQLHRRRGFRSGFFLSNVWALAVDFAIGAIILWGLTGLWMWWEMKKLRSWGGLALLAGAGLFLFFFFLI